MKIKNKLGKVISNKIKVGHPINRIFLISFVVLCYFSHGTLSRSALALFGEKIDGQLLSIQGVEKLIDYHSFFLVSASYNYKSHKSSSDRYEEEIHVAVKEFDPSDENCIFCDYIYGPEWEALDYDDIVTIDRRLPVIYLGFCPAIHLAGNEVPLNSYFPNLLLFTFVTFLLYLASSHKGTKQD